MPRHDYVNGKIYRGVLTGLNEAFVIDAETRDNLIAEDPKSEDLIKPFLIGKDIKRYQLPESERYLIFTRRGVDIQQYPAIVRHLLQFKERLMPKPKDWEGGKWPGRKSGDYEWYEIQDTIAYYEEFEKTKIVYLVFQVRPAFTFDNGSFYCNNAIFVIPNKDLLLLGILNSKLGWFLISSYCTQIQSGYQLIFKYFGRIPIHMIDFSDPDDKSHHDKVVMLVKHMLELHEQLSKATEESEKTVLQKQIDETDQQLDNQVYELYELTEEEIAIVERNSK
jgi:hypothetical protein